jgi:cation-transporting ATPase 13A3/4/5
VAAALPPLLPTVFVVSVGVGNSRLSDRGVLCSDPSRLLVAGKVRRADFLPRHTITVGTSLQVRVCCFDKTGTITKPGMDFLGVREMASAGRFAEQSVQASPGGPLEAAMASCHALSKFKHSGSSNPMLSNQVEGEYMLVGATVDKLMFEVRDPPRLARLCRCVR